MVRIRCPWLVLLLCLGAQLQAQNLPRRGGGSGASLERDTSSRPEGPIPVPPDTIPLRVSMYQAHNPSERLPFNDTLLNNYLHQADPSRQKALDDLHLGSMGTPSRSLLYELQPRAGFQMGFRQFDLYWKDLDEVWYYQTNRTFTEVHYAQPHTKDDFNFTGTFARNLKPGWGINIDYDRISHQGVYAHQKSRHTALTINSPFQWGRNYRGFASYTFNDIQQEDNGGVEPGTDFNNSLYQNQVNIPVRLNTANTRTKAHRWAYTHYYDLLGKDKDSTGQAPSQRQLLLGHAFSYETGQYKFSDNSPDADSAFYGPLQVYNPGMRHYLDWHSLENDFHISFHPKGKNKGPDKARLTLGLGHEVHWVGQEPVDTNIQNLILHGHWKTQLLPGFLLDAEGRYYLGDNANEYWVQGRISKEMGDWGRMEARIQNQRFSPDLVQQRAYVSKLLLYENDFAKPITTSLSVGYQLPKARTALEFRYHILTNPIYYDTLSLARQESGSIQLLQGVLSQGIRLGKWHWDNTLVLQSASKDVLRLPSYFIKSSLYWEGNVFKRVMLARTGLDFRMHSRYRALAYQPLLGQFHQQDGEEIGMYPALDVFLSFKVKTFRGFMKMENITGWLTNDVFYLTPGHPIANPHFSFGVTWLFID